MLRLLSMVSLGLVSFCSPAVLSAHFVWVVSENGVAKVYFGEGLEPDQAEFLTGIATSKLYRWNGTTYEPVEYTLRKDGDLGWFEVANAGDRALALTCDYGVFTRGEKSMRLDYTARFQQCGTPLQPFDQLHFDIRPEVDHGKLKLVALYEGRPDPDCEIVIAYVGDDADSVTTKTDSNGNAEIQIKESKRVLIRGKKVLNVEGELNGQKYSEHRHYCTVVLDNDMSKTDLMPPKTLAENAPRMLASVPDLPFAITSFGAARIGHSAYVFGGQMGEAHAYARSWQNGKLLRLDTNSPNPEWTVISERDGAQGLALVAFNERLYRIGGFEARNEEGEENDLHSLDVFESYDPSTGNWQTLPSLPAPRSSFDACVVDGRIYVVGGWTMRGSEPTIGCDTALVYDLNEQHAQWRELPVPPFKRRALSVAASNGRLYAIGGIGDDGKTSSAVDQFVITENKWLPGMSLPECGDLKGFGSCSFVVDNSVVVSVSDGKFLRFDVYNNQWVTLKQKLDPGRFFHRILPVSNSAILAISGANMEIGKFSDSVIVNLGEKN